MSKSFRLTAFALLALAALAAFTATPAQASGSYSFTSIGTTEGAACTSASSAVAGHCVLHGPITTTSLGCLPIYNSHGDFLGYLCRCTASTPFCYTPPVLPFP